MFLLPHILYFSRTLPIPILQTDIVVLQKIINHFIWASRKPRIKSFLLPGPMWVLEFLTLGFTTRQLYWIKLKKLWNMDSLQPWTQIETGALTQNPSSILAAVWMGYHQPRFHLPTVNATITTWKSILQASAGLHIQALQQLPILALSLLSPYLPLQQWATRGLQKIGDLFQQTHLLGFALQPAQGPL